jgi:hypothetical protein
MLTNTLLPQVFWFRLAIPCWRADEMLKVRDQERLLELPASSALPYWGELDGHTPWAEVRIGWNPQGIAIAVTAADVSPAQLAPDRPEGFAHAQFWIDTRDTRNISRATRFCHRFHARLAIAKPRGQLSVEVTQRPIARAQADAPICKPELIESRSQLGKSGWSLEIFLPAAAMNGFDPETNRRLGFAYQIGDHIHADQFLGVGREFPIGENPSLWGTLELRD